ncbi:metallophosphoesterase [Paenibacillus sp.]|uniref:metallophosphoesterase family protein n=1 Tax=Paenibacillus sp. TaxID=58172 RepID=UPI002811E691|nr:metallophosphoesterase [Paenibacillus sp.]
MSADRPLFSFSVVSDLHFMAYADPGETPVDWVPFLTEEIAYLASLEPRFVVCNGDLTNGKLRDYRLAMGAFRPCEMPVYFTMGNHEYYGRYEEPECTSERAQARFLAMTRMPGIYYERIHEGFPFLFLSTEHYTPDSNEAGWLREAQLTWLEDRLRAHAGAPTFVFMHHPLNDTVAGSEGTCLASERVRSLLDRRKNALLFSGHTHCRMDRDDQLVRRGGNVFVGGGCMYEEHPQSRWVDVYEDRAVLRLLCHRERRWLDAFEATARY